MAKAKSKKKIIKRPEKRGNVFYIMSPQCGWCKKADPIVKELTVGGYKITTIDALDIFFCTLSLSINPR